MMQGMKTTQVIWTSTPATLQNYVFLHKPRSGVLHLGETHRRDHRFALHLYLRPPQKRRLHPRLHRWHRKHSPRAPTATPCSPVLRALLPVANFVRLLLQIRANRTNRAASAGLFQKDTLQQVHKLGSPKLGSYGNLDIAHQLNDTSSTEYAYATTNAQGIFSAGEKEEENPNIFKEAMGLPQAASWKAAPDRETASLEKHGVYELVPITAVPAGQGVIGTWWV